VYVFATHTCREPDQYDPLDLRLWEFQVMSRRELEPHGVRSVSRAFLDRHAPEIYGLAGINAAIERAHARGGAPAEEAAP
jgi:hypothetical protein